MTTTDGWNSEEEADTQHGERSAPGWVRQWWLLAVVTFLTVAVIATVAIPSMSYLAAYPSRQVAPLATQVSAMQVAQVDPTPVTEKDRLALQRDLLQYETDNQIKIWTAIIQAIGALGVAAGLSGVFSWINGRRAQERAKLDQQRLEDERRASVESLKVLLDRLEVDRETQITNRFMQAVAQLGSELNSGQPNLEVRIGGIYALERIARDSPRDQWTILEVLTAYVRMNARWSTGDSARSEEPRSDQQPLRTDIQAVLTVLGRRRTDSYVPEPGRLDLRETDLRSADLRGAHLEDADLSNAHLGAADLRGAQMQRSRLHGTIMRQANLDSTALESADLSDSQLQESYLGAYLKDADFDRATLDGADLSRASGVTLEQVRRAASLKDVRLPPKLQFELDAESNQASSAPATSATPSSPSVSELE